MKLPEPYYRDELVTLYHGDLEEILPLLTAAGVAPDLFVTSPPYNLGAAPWPALGHWKPGDGAGGKSKWRNGSDAGGGVQYDDHEDTMPWPDYVAWQHRTWRAMWAALATTGAIFWNHKTRVIGARLWKPDELIPDDLPIRQEIVWARAGGMNFNPTAFVPTHERIFVVATDDWRLKSKGASGIGDVWTIPQEPSPHPAPFPVGLPARAIDATAPKLVCDPFCGSGSTMRAAVDAGVPSIGIDKSDAYLAMAVDRLKQPSIFSGERYAQDGLL